MSEPDLTAREKLLHWMLDLLERDPGSWSQPQQAFIDSLFKGQEGTKLLAQLAVATSHLRNCGLTPEAMGKLRLVHEAMEAFWNNPSPETYEALHAAGESLNFDS